MNTDTAESMKNRLFAIIGCNDYTSTHCRWTILSQSYFILVFIGTVATGSHVLLLDGISECTKRHPAIQHLKYQLYDISAECRCSDVWCEMKLHHVEHWITFSHTAYWLYIKNEIGKKRLAIFAKLEWINHNCVIRSSSEQRTHSLK